MDRVSSEEILLAIRELRPRWQDLLGVKAANQADIMMASLDPDDDENTRRTSNRLLELFRQHKAIEELREALARTRLAADHELAGFGGEDQIGERLYQPVPGESGPIASPEITYRCPVPGCNHTWRPQAAGKPVPFCPHHPDHRLVEV